jgi:leucyl aminopeptidase
MNVFPHPPEKETTATKLIFVGKKDLQNHEYAQIFETLQFQANFGQSCFLPEYNVLYIGIDFDKTKKTADHYHTPNYYSLGASIVDVLEKTTLSVLSVEPAEYAIIIRDSMYDILLGIAQKSWQFTQYNAPKNRKPKVFTVYLHKDMGSMFSDYGLLDELQALNTGITLTRNLVNETPETINPQSIQNILIHEFDTYPSVKVTFLQQNKIQDLGMEGVLMVGRGSRFAPCISHIVLPAKSKKKHTIVLIGKGVTYDSGGLDVKIQGGMKGMKTDMAGAATMSGVMKTLAILGGLEHTEVHWLSAWVENMISGESYKTDDIITTHSGQTVEIFNTDAEGRLTLADMLSYATTLDPDYIVDAATLTGAAIYAWSEYVTALMGNDKTLLDSIMTAFESQHEQIAQTRMPEVLRESVSGTFGDLINTATLERQAGHITAGLFLSNFIDQTQFRGKNFDVLQEKSRKIYSWAHLDIAGTASNSNRNDLQVKGATGHGVRSLVHWLKQL